MRLIDGGTGAERDVLVAPRNLPAPPRAVDRRSRPVTLLGSEPPNKKPDRHRRARFASRLATAIIVFGLVVIFVPVGKHDIESIAADNQAAPLLGEITSPSTQPSSTTTTAEANVGVPQQDRFVLDMAAIYAEVGTLPGVDPTSLDNWVEPKIEQETDWVDSGNGVKVPDLLLRIRFCESTNNYQAANPSSSARGAYQFLTKSWVWYGFAEEYGAAQAHLASPVQQDAAALSTYRRVGARPWAESRACWGDPGIDERYRTAKVIPAQPAPTAAPTTSPNSTSSTAPLPPTSVSSTSTTTAAG